MLHPVGQNLVTCSCPAAKEAGECPYSETACPTKSHITEEEKEKKYWCATNLCLNIIIIGENIAKYPEYMRYTYKQIKKN